MDIHSANIIYSEFLHSVGALKGILTVCSELGLWILVMLKCVDAYVVVVVMQYVEDVFIKYTYHIHAII